MWLQKFLKHNIFASNIKLAFDIACTDLRARYKRSSMGWIWMVLNPLLLLGVYWTVFGGLLKLEWENPYTGTSLGYIIPFFAGLIVYLIFSDIVSSSSNLLIIKRNYVINSPFPVWVLWLANLIRIAIHGVVMLGILVTLALYQELFVVSGIGWALVTIIQISIFMAGLSLLLCTLGPFVGDISEISRIVVRVFFYATPISYPLVLVPQEYRDFLWFNPLTNLVETLRGALLFGTAPNSSYLLLTVCGNVILFSISVWCFQRTKGVITDVV